MRFFSKRVIFLSFLAFASYVGQVFAAGSGAYRIEVPDAGAVGKGSAFVGEANTPASVYYNPAGLTQMKGAALAVGAALIQPHEDYTSNSGEESAMQRGSHGLPHVYFVSDLGTERFSFGLGALSSWGLATEWNADSFARYAATKSSLENRNYLLTAAYEIDDQWSIALGVDIDDSKVDKQKKIFQGGAGDANFRLKGTDVGASYRAAALFRLNEQHQFGFVYRTPIERKYQGKVMLDNLNNTYAVPGIGAPYQTIFGGSSYETDVVSKATLPQSVVLGYSYKPTSKWTFNFDVEWMDWSTTNEEELAYPSESSAARLAILNNGNPASRDWVSVFSGAMGAEYALNERTRLRAGYYYHVSPVPDDNWEPNLPDADSQGITLGSGYDFNKNLTLDLAWSGILYKDRTIDNSLVDAFGGIDGTYRQWTNLLYATVTYRF